MKRMLRRCSCLLILASCVCVIASAEETAVKARLDSWVTMVQPVNLDKPSVKLTMIYRGGKDKIRIAFPTAEEMVGFRGVRLEVDGVDAAHVLDTSLDNVALTDIRHLKPGESTELVVPLDKIFKLPSTWKRLVVLPRRRHRLDGIRGGVVILRPDEDKVR